ncbi:MAG: Ig-like domain-containing protein [Candidatus Sericytochromatia bacterium]|nr:Ig-like domain-containing protein [Candidatus Sericytochromatia bacterium]
MTQTKLWLPLCAAASLSLLVACGPAANQTTTGTGVKVTAAVAVGDTLTGTVTFADNTTENFSFTLTSTRYADLISQLESLTSCTTFSFKETSNGNGTVEPGDVFDLSLSGSPKNAAGTKTIAKVTITGGTAASKLGIPANFAITPAGAASTQDCPAPSAPPASATPSAPPSAEATATPVSTAAPTQAPPASATPTPAATNTPLPAATSDISVIEKTTFNGKVFDDSKAPLDGVTVKARSLNASVPFEESTVTAGGTYAFNNAPSGIQVEIVASKTGFTTRKRVEVLKSNKQGDPNANRYDFGNDCADFVPAAVLEDNGCSKFSAAYNALSDKPEVVAVTPARNGSGVDPQTSFVLKFSEPMDKKTAEDTFTVRSFNNRKLTVDNGNLRVAGGANTVKGNGAITNNWSGTNASKIWDKDAFNISWNSDDTEVTFSFKEEKLLPTDKDSNLVPDYNVAFNGFNSSDRLIKDKSGISRSEKHFKLTDGDFEESYKFSIKTDEAKPGITGLTAETTENGGQNGDAVRVRYSERMIIYTRDISIAGGMENIAGADQKAPAGYPGANQVASTLAAAKNYNTTVVQTGGVTTFSGTWGSLCGTAVYDTTDLTHKTVLLLPAKSASSASNAYLLNAPNTVTGSFKTDGANGGPGATSGENTLVIQLLKNSSDCATFAVTVVDPGVQNLAVVNLNENLADNAAFAADLQTKLNLSAAALGVNGPSTNAFMVTSTATTLTVSFNDTSGKYIGWRQQTAFGANSANEVLPQFNTGGLTLVQGQNLDIYKPGDTVRIKVNSTVLDPAGNTLDSSRDNASANAS